MVLICQSTGFFLSHHFLSQHRQKQLIQLEQQGLPKLSMDGHNGTILQSSTAMLGSMARSISALEIEVALAACSRQKRLRKLCLLGIPLLSPRGCALAAEVLSQKLQQIVCNCKQQACRCPAQHHLPPS